MNDNLRIYHSVKRERQKAGFIPPITLTRWFIPCSLGLYNELLSFQGGKRTSDTVLHLGRVYKIYKDVRMELV